jgi:serine/threonine protein kinase
MSCLRDRFDNVLLDGRFETVAPLNHGSFGMVFMAKDHVTNEMVAIKCLTKRSAASEVGLGLAIDDKSEELILHRQLSSHPNIVNLVHSFETESHVYIVLEFCSRGDLYEAIRNGEGPLETERVRQFMLELVDAVSYIHAKGIYHRDIKPENIFLTQAGAMKLGDFGLATTEEWTYEAAVGSDRYMSPEQYDSAGAGYSPAQADIWAIGICLLNILFSRNPFTTPTESDPLFLDFSRDKQSLFDVFPSMSQDTYEVLVQCLSLDPKKRSLAGVRAALQRVVSFTTLEEALDDFCTGDRKVGASSNREPLRTPSLQSPQPVEGAFPWHKAIQGSQPRPFRRLDTIPDNEAYSEELFPKSEESTADWFSGAGNTPSASSVLESHLGVSISSVAPSRAINAPQRPMVRAAPVVGSLPITMSKPRAVPTLSTFGARKQGFSKSWSDMWEEDEEEEEEERNRQYQALLNARTWSHESQSGNATIVPDSSSGDNDMGNDIDDHVEDGFFQHDMTPSVKPEAAPSTRYSPPTTRRANNHGGSAINNSHNNLDKWAALGERRRAYTGGSDIEKSPDLRSTRRQFAFNFASNGGVGNTWDHFSAYHNHQNSSNKDRVRDRPSFNKARDWNWRRDNRRADVADVEWVGGWHDAH